jgi:uncharacterized membrane protein YdbT with pleckstrin-like domain
MTQYVEQSLSDEETILVEGRFPSLYWAGAWLTLILLGPFLIGIYFFLRWAVHMSTTEFAVTDRRVILKRGLFSRSTQEIAIERVEGVQLEQSLWGRLFGYGRLDVKGTGDTLVRFPNMTAPEKFRAAIDNSRDRTHAVHFDSQALEQLGDVVAT